MFGSLPIVADFTHYLSVYLPVSLPPTEYTFLAYAVATCLGIVITIIVVFGFNGLYYYNSSLTDLELYDMSIMCYAVLATIVPARIARIEAKQATTRVFVTKKNVTEKLSYPLMEMYEGLDKLLHTDNVVEHLQPDDMLRLSQLTLTCNEALHCLEGIVSMDINERQTMESDTSGGEKEGTGTGMVGHKTFSTRVMSSIVASTTIPPLSPPPPPDRFLVTPRNQVTFSDPLQQRDNHLSVVLPLNSPRRVDSIFSRHEKISGQQEEQEVISILSNSMLSDPLVANKHRINSDGWGGINRKTSSEKGSSKLSSELTISHVLQLQTRPHINMFQSDVEVEEVVAATDKQQKQQQLLPPHRSQDLSTTYDGKEAEANDEYPLRPTVHTFGGAYYKSSNSMMQMALGRNTSSAASTYKQQQQRSMFALPSIPEAAQMMMTTSKEPAHNEELGASAQWSQKSTDWLLADDDAEKNGHDDNKEVVTMIVAPQNERIMSEVEPTLMIFPTTQDERVPLALPTFIAEQFIRGRRFTFSEAATSDMDKTSADYSALSADDAPSYTFTYDYSFNSGPPVEDDKPGDYNYPPRIPLSAKLTPLQLYTKLPSTHMVRTRYSHLDGTNPQLLELVASNGVRHVPRMLHPSSDTGANDTAPVAQRRAYIRSVSSSVALGFVPIGSAAGVDRDGQPLGCSNGGGMGDEDNIREANGDAIALFTWRLLAVVRADLRAASDLFDLQLSSLLAEPTPAEAAAATSSSSSGGVMSSEDRLREAFLLKCAQWKAMEEDGMVELRAHLNVVQTMVLKAAVSLSVTLDCVLLSDAADREGKLDSGERDRRPVSFSPPVAF